MTTQDPFAESAGASGMPVEEQVDTETPEMPPPDLRLTAYKVILTALMSGEDIDPEDLSYLAWGIYRDPDIDIQDMGVPNLDEVLGAIKDTPMDMPFQQAIASTDVAVEDEFAMEIINTIATVGLSRGYQAVRGITRGIRAGVNAAKVSTGGIYGGRNAATFMAPKAIAAAERGVARAVGVLPESIGRKIPFAGKAKIGATAYTVEDSLAASAARRLAGSGPYTVQTPHSVMRNLLAAVIRHPFASGLSAAAILGTGAATFGTLDINGQITGSHVGTNAPGAGPPSSRQAGTDPGVGGGVAPTTSPTNPPSTPGIPTTTTTTAPSRSSTTPIPGQDSWMRYADSRPSWARWWQQSRSPTVPQSVHALDMSSLEQFLQGRDPMPGALDPTIIGILEDSGSTPEEIQQFQLQSIAGYDTPNPLALGFFTFSPNYFPSGATGAGTPAMSPLTSTETQEALKLYGDILNNANSPVTWLDNPIFGNPSAIVAKEGLEDFIEGQPNASEVKPGGTIINAAFAMWQGKTLLQWTLDIAKANGVPPALLYGMIALESGYDPTAEGDNGDSIGLAQINQPAFPNITTAQRLNPVWSLTFAAIRLQYNKIKLGTWEAALMAHNSPARAAEYAATGTLSNATARNQILSYAGAALNYAAQSGIGNQLFDFDSLNAAGAGPPPKDTSAREISNYKAFIRDIWEQWMGPGPADEAYLNQWARSMFNGSKGEDDVTQSIRAMAAGRWPSKPADLTWTEWATPYRNQMEFMLEIPKMENTDPLLNKVLNEPIEGRDLELLIRNDSRWTATENFRDQFSSVAEQLGETFGFTAIR